MSNLKRDDNFHRLVGEAVQEFIVLERKFYLSLSEAESKTFDYQGRGGLWLACNQRHHVQFLLTLKGHQSCVFVNHELHASEAFEGYIDEVWEYILSKYNIFNYGFNLHDIQHNVDFDTGEDNSLGMSVRDSFIRKGSCIFFDQRSSEMQVMKKAFGQREDLIISRYDKQAYFDRLEGYLGWPCRWYPKETYLKVQYIDKTETETVINIIGNGRNPTDENLCVIGIEFACNSESDIRRIEKAITAHFDKCSEAMKIVGHALKANLSELELRYENRLVSKSLGSASMLNDALVGSNEEPIIKQEVLEEGSF